MPDHIYDKKLLIRRLESCLNKTFGQIDNIGIFDRIQRFPLQKGVAGTVVEQCIFGYAPDSRQEADLIVVDGNEETKTEVKTTGMVIKSQPVCHYVAKEPMSITAVGVYDIAGQDFWTSHFWEKIEHMLIIYYHYDSKMAVPPYEYRLFPLRGYEFHEFSPEEITTLRHDWECVHDLCATVVSHHPGPRTESWKAEVKQEYLAVHGQLRRVLSYVDLAPKFPPRFRLKKPTVSVMIAKHFGYELEQLPERYATVSDVDLKCHILTQEYRGKTLGELAELFGVPKTTKDGKENKGIAEQIVVQLFGGQSKKMNRIELFERFGLIAKTVTMTSLGGRTEDMKLFHINFEEMLQEEFIEEDGTTRKFVFEDSELYSYFADHEFLCIICEEPKEEFYRDPVTGRRKKKQHPLILNTFLGFKRLVFSDEFIESTVKYVWEHTRNTIFGGELRDVINYNKDGTPQLNKCGSIRSAPNFVKSSECDVFIRGSGNDSSAKSKTEYVRDVHMLPQFIWVKGSGVILQLQESPWL